MFNALFVEILERLSGRKMAVLLGAVSGTTEKTWRSRLKKGWDPTEVQITAIRKRTNAILRKRLKDVGGWTADEAREIVDGIPSNRLAGFLPTADLIYYSSPLFGKYCQETLALATRFDRDCASLYEALLSKDVERVRDVLLTMFHWLMSFCIEENETSNVQELREKLGAASDIENLIKTAAPLHEALLCHVLSCWDVEFCAGYFDGTMVAYPLFELVMPRFSPDIEIEAGSGRLLRAGKQPRKLVFETATMRFLNFVSFLVAWRRYNRHPKTATRIKDLAAWSGMDEGLLVSWRDESTRLTASQLEDFWIQSFVPDRKGIYPAIPSPVFVCAHIWSPLLVREGRRPTGLFDAVDTYRGWWECNRSRLVGQGLQFGSKAWPDYLVDQLPAARPLASSCSSQSSGRSSSPRDCQ